MMAAADRITKLHIAEISKGTKLDGTVVAIKIENAHSSYIRSAVRIFKQ